VLAVHPTLSGSDGKLPIVLYQFVGAGKSMFNAVDDTWRWRFRVGDRYFGRYWIQTIRFLARSKLLGRKQAEVSTDRRRYQRNQPVQVRVRFPNPGIAPTSGEVVVQVERKGQGPRKLVLKASPGTRNVFEGALPQVVEGEYEIRLLPPPVLEGPIPSTAFRVDAPAGELERVQMNESELIRAAATSGGKFYTPPRRRACSRTSQAAEGAARHRSADPALEYLAGPGAVPGVITAEWLLRKRKQMV
jgi:hypothetical protein